MIIGEYRKLYKRKDRPGFKNGSTLYYRICDKCGKDSSKNGRRNFDLCDTCYVKYRQAVKLFHTAKDRCNKRNIPFNLTIEFIENKLYGKCERTGLDFVFGKGSDYSNRHPQTPSLDQIIPGAGYTLDNIQVVCWWYNSAKQRYSDKEVLEYCKAVVNFSNMVHVKNVDQAMP